MLWFATICGFKKHDWVGIQLGIKFEQLHNLRIIRDGNDERKKKGTD